MTGLAILIVLTVTMTALAYWVGDDPELDAKTLRIYRDGELAGKDRALRMKEDGATARERGRRFVQHTFAAPKGGGTGAKGSR